MYVNRKGYEGPGQLLIIYDKFYYFLNIFNYSRYSCRKLNFLDWIVVARGYD